MTVVAKAFGMRTEVVRRRAFHETLLDFWQLQEIDEHERVVEDLRDVNRAGMFAAAFHDPKQIGKLELEAKRRAGLLPSVEVVRRRALEQAKRIREGRVLDDG